MSREVPGALDPTWGNHPAWTHRRCPRVADPKRKAKVHLRVSLTSTFSGPACGNDLRVERRFGDGANLTLTDVLDDVTCATCRKSYAFQDLERRNQR